MWKNGDVRRNSVYSCLYHLRKCSGFVPDVERKLNFPVSLQGGCPLDLNYCSFADMDIPSQGECIMEVLHMPLVEMYFGAGTLSAEQKADLSRKITDLIVKEAKQPQHYTWVIINEVPVENWMVDRLTLTELKAKLIAEKE